tara:strand:+ start:1487 stop:1996 length:510 start_codon:yes stop_codon:yes gene_type:complete
MKLTKLILENAEAELEDAFDDFEKEIKKADLDAPESEAIGLTIAGVALSFGEIQKLLGKFVNLISKIPGFKKLSGDRLIGWGNKNHHRVVGAFEKIIKLAGVKDAKKAHKAAEVLHMVVVALLLYKGVGGMASKFGKGKLMGAAFKGALNAVKSNEIGVFLKDTFASLG